MRRPRIGIASILQETNTWSPVTATLETFTCHGLAVGSRVFEDYGQTNTEIGGALEAVVAAEAVPVPLLRAWGSSAGRLTAATLDELCGLLSRAIHDEHLDGLSLSLHGALAAENVDSADTALLSAARAALPAGVPVAVTLDLHANLTSALVSRCDVLVGYRTYPHIDHRRTGASGVGLLLGMLEGRIRPAVAFAKRPMVLPAEALSTRSGPFAKLRKFADRLADRAVLDVSLFPVQPWLDVAELGFGVSVVTDGDPARAQALADTIAERAWEQRHDFVVDLVSPEQAIAAARRSPVRPFLISHSADAPTAGAPGDSPAMVDALLRHGGDLVAYVTVTDAAAVAECVAAGEGASVSLRVGACLDGRFDRPVALRGEVVRIDDSRVVITGPSLTGMDVSMGTFAVVRSGRLHVLISERPAFTLDQATFVHAGLDPAAADIIVVRSANGFRSGYPAASAEAAVFVDLPGVSTPRLDLLDFVRAPRPLYPLDAGVLTAGRHAVEPA